MPTVCALLWAAYEHQLQASPTVSCLQSLALRWVLQMGDREVTVAPVKPPQHVVCCAPGEDISPPLVFSLFEEVSEIPVGG